jgi:hypothetical protein
MRAGHHVGHLQLLMMHMQQCYTCETMVALGPGLARMWHVQTSDALAVVYRTTKGVMPYARARMWEDDGGERGKQLQPQLRLPPYSSQ